tara:strand:+ start:1662 stop:2996 length:1335 start_codon:yes stop_codon:yes gene_type:complete
MAPPFDKKYCHINTKNFDVACVGDIHGDPSVLIQTLESLRYGSSADNSVPLLVIPNDVKQWANACDCSNNNTMLPLEAMKKIAFNVSSLHKPFVFVLLGDLLDNVRLKIEVHYGNELRGGMGFGNMGCGGPVTQLGMLMILVQVHKVLKSKGGYVLWIAGNHDIANVDPTSLNAHICDKNAPLLNAKIDKKSKVTPYPTCDANKGHAFSQEHVDNVLSWMQQLPTFTMGTITHIDALNNKKLYLLVHGYLSMSLLQAMIPHVGEKLQAAVMRATNTRDPVPVINMINTQFSPLFYLPDNKRQINARNSALALNQSLHPKTPWWCRAFENGAMIDDENDVPLNIGIDVVVKGHDVHAEPKHLTSQFSDGRTFEVYCMDTGSSVSMGPHNKVVARLLFSKDYDPEISVTKNMHSVYYGDQKISPCMVSEKAAMGTHSKFLNIRRDT